MQERKVNIVLSVEFSSSMGVVIIGVISIIVKMAL